MEPSKTKSTTRQLRHHFSFGPFMESHYWKYISRYFSSYNEGHHAEHGENYKFKIEYHFGSDDMDIRIDY